jgi:hypothetical protein
MKIRDILTEQGVAEAIDIGSEWMTDTELDQYVPDQLQQQWRELVGYDAEGNVSALWANITGGYEPDANDPEDRANMVRVANKWFAMKRIPNVRFFDVRDVGDELEWLVQIGSQGVAEDENQRGMGQTIGEYDRSGGAKRPGIIGKTEPETVTKIDPEAPGSVRTMPDGTRQERTAQGWKTVSAAPAHRPRAIEEGQLRQRMLELAGIDRMTETAPQQPETNAAHTDPLAAKAADLASVGTEQDPETATTIDEDDNQRGLDHAYAVYGNRQGYYAWRKSPLSPVLNIGITDPQLTGITDWNPQSIQDFVKQHMKPVNFNSLSAGIKKLILRELPLQKQDVSETMGGTKPLTVAQLATISDAALDQAYGYGRSTPGNTFGWQANLQSAAQAKKMIDAGITDIERIADAIHRGWNVTAQKFVTNPDQFADTEKLRAAGKLEAKLDQRAKLMRVNYAQLPDDEQEKDRVVARALLQALTGAK